jgi:hypothetical protein
VAPRGTLAAAPQASVGIGTIRSAEGIRVDGALGDWAGAPTLVWDDGDDDGDDAALWLAVSSDRVVLAASGETRDVQLDLASPPSRFPAIGFASHLDEQVLESAADCERLPTLAQSETDELRQCYEFYAAALNRHAEVRSWFSRTLRVAGDEVWVDGVKAPARVVRGPDGAFEVELPSDVLPATTEAPLRRLELSLGVAGATPIDVGAVEFASAVSFGTPSLLQAILGDETEQLRFYRPGPVVDRVGVAFNRPVGFQHTPTEPSPFVGAIPLGPRRRLAHLGGRWLVEVPRSYDLDVVDGYAWEDASGNLTLLPLPPAGYTDFRKPIVLPRRGAIDLLFAQETIRNPFGAGYCGACPTAALRVLRVTADGLTLKLDERVDPGDGEGVTVAVNASQGALSARFPCRGHDATEADQAKYGTVAFRYRARTGEYEREEQTCQE